MRIALAVLFCVSVFLGYRLTVVENERYALLVGSCQAGDWRCLKAVQTRTSWLWHLYYGLGA
jgi:succinate dehydrogenase hydrophobic anchor subunit